MVVRGRIIAISAADNKLRREKRQDLESEVARLETIHKRTGAPRVWRQLRQARAQLQLIDQSRAEYALIRLKHKYYSEGNRAGKLLALKLRAKTKIEGITRLINRQGQITHDTEEILGEFRAFYESLYDERLRDAQKFR